MPADEVATSGALDPYEEYEVDDDEYNCVPERAKLSYRTAHAAEDPSLWTIHLGGHLATIIDGAMNERAANANFG